MKKLLAILVALLVVPMVLGTNTGIGVGIDITPEEFGPLIWLCDSRTVYDDNLQGGRDTGEGEEMLERNNNYAFEGEQIEWQVLVMDKNKIEEVQDVVATIGSTQGVGNDIEVECVRDFYYDDGDTLDPACNARIDEEVLDTFDADTMESYICTLTVETPLSMYGEYFVTIEAIGTDGSAIIDENEYWYFNPIIGLSVDGELLFTDVRPGSAAYSETLLVGNDADPGSGVLLDMFISGTDFYDPASSGSRCPVTNRLKLGDNTAESIDDGPALEASITGDDVCNIDYNSDNDESVGDTLCYYATSGAYSTQNDPRSDDEGYVGIVYGDEFSTAFYNDAEIMGGSSYLSIGGVNYFAGNVLTPGSELAMTFKLGLPEPCVGDFSDGSIYFWGEAI